MNLFQKNYDHFRQQVVEEKAFIATDQEMVDMVENEVRELV